MTINNAININTLLSFYIAKLHELFTRKCSKDFLIHLILTYTSVVSTIIIFLSQKIWGTRISRGIANFQ